MYVSYPGCTPQEGRKEGKKGERMADNTTTGLQPGWVCQQYSQGRAYDPSSTGLQPGWIYGPTVLVQPGKREKSI